MKPFAVFLDIDGTLMWEGRISERVQVAIAAAQRRGHRFFINTGRSFAYLPPQVMNAVEWDGVVAGIGADVRIGDKQVYSRVAPVEVLREIAAFFVAGGRSVMMEGEDSLVCCGNTIPAFSQMAPEELPEDLKISKLTFFGTLTEPELAALAPHFTLIQHPTYAEAAIRGCDKGTGVKKALEALGIPVERSIAMGDSRNDWDMLDVAGISVAMGNGDEETKARCTVVAPTAAEDGVAWAIEQYLA